MNKEIEEIRNRLHLYKDVATYPVLNDLESCLSHISTLEEKGKRDRKKIEKFGKGIREFLARCHREDHGIPEFVFDELMKLLEEMK